MASRGGSDMARRGRPGVGVRGSVEGAGPRGELIDMMDGCVGYSRGQRPDQQTGREDPNQR
jgi:hypothetical protein